MLAPQAHKRTRNKQAGFYYSSLRSASALRSRGVPQGEIKKTGLRNKWLRDGWFTSMLTNIIYSTVPSPHSVSPLMCEGDR